MNDYVIHELKTASALGILIKIVLALILLGEGNVSRLNLFFCAFSCQVEYPKTKKPTLSLLYHYPVDLLTFLELYLTLNLDRAYFWSSSNTPHLRPSSVPRIRTLRCVDYRLRTTAGSHFQDWDECFFIPPSPAHDGA